MMKQYMAVAALVAVTGVHADWKQLGTSGGNAVYVDPGTNRKVSDSVRKVWSLIDLQSPESTPAGQVHSARSQDEYDCKQEKSRRLYTSYHARPMGEGTAVATEGESSAWIPVAPNSAGLLLWRAACEGGASTASASPAPPAGPAPEPPSAKSSAGLFGGWLTGKMIALATGEELKFEIEKSRGTGGLWAYNPGTGEIFSGQYTGRFTGGGVSHGTVSGLNSAGRFTTQNVQVFTPPTGANAQGYLRGDKGTVVELFFEITPGLRPRGSGSGVDAQGRRYQAQF